jgi:hypothetical protein
MTHVITALATRPRRIAVAARVKLLHAEDGSLLGVFGCWPPATHSVKTIAANVPPNTRFTVWATTMHPSPMDNTWGGTIYY